MALPSAFLGIDPGKSGGLGLLLPKRRGRGFTHTPMAWRMPKTEVEIWRLVLEITTLHPPYPLHVVLEHVHAMPRQGVSSCFTFGVGYGGLRMALVAAGLKFEIVHPSVWQKELGVFSSRKKGADKPSKKEHKNSLRERARELFSGIVVTSHTADALLLAEYARRQENGRTSRRR